MMMLMYLKLPVSRFIILMDLVFLCCVVILTADILFNELAAGRVFRDIAN